MNKTERQVIHLNDVVAYQLSVLCLGILSAVACLTSLVVLLDFAHRQKYQVVDTSPCLQVDTNLLKANLYHVPSAHDAALHWQNETLLPDSTPSDMATIQTNQTARAS